MLAATAQGSVRRSVLGEKKKRQATAMRAGLAARDVTISSKRNPHPTPVLLSPEPAFAQ